MTILFDFRGRSAVVNSNDEDISFVFIFRPIIFCFDAEEFHFDGIFVFATIANRQGETDPTFDLSQSTLKFVEISRRREKQLKSKDTTV